MQIACAVQSRLFIKRRVQICVANETGARTINLKNYLRTRIIRKVFGKTYPSSAGGFFRADDLQDRCAPFKLFRLFVFHDNLLSLSILISLSYVELYNTKNENTISIDK